MTVTLTYDSQLSRVRVDATIADLRADDFEAGITGWEAVGGTVAHSTLQAHGGTGSLLLTPDGTSETVRARTILASSPTVVEGEDHEFSVWVYSVNGYTVDISVEYFDAASISLDFVIWTTVTVPAATWTQLVATRTAPAGATTAQLNVNQRTTPAASDELYVDDVRFRTTTATVERSTDQVLWETVRGGQWAALTNAGTLKLDDYEFTTDTTNYYRVRTEIASIMPTLTRVWLKSIARPYLNRAVIVVDFSEVERAARTGVFPIVGRSFPIAVSDVRSGKSYTLELLTETASDERDLDLFLASGDPAFLHVPADSMVPGGYYTIGDTSARRLGRTSVKRVFSLPLQEIAAPDPDVVGATSTYNTVLTSYATYQALLDAHADYESVLELIGSPTEVIVS